MQVSATLLLELGVILTVLTVLGTAARRFALSPIPLYLVAGLALGEGGIAPIPAATQFVSTGASIGVVLLLLTLGLEFSIGEFASSLRRHLPSAWVDVLLNAVPGAIAGALLGLNGVGILALAGVTYISSSGVIARLLSDLRRLGNRETPAVLSILVLEDFAMAAYLPLLAVLAAGGTWIQALLGMAIAIAALSLAFFASYRWGHHVGRIVAHPDNEQMLLRILGLTLIVAALAEFVHASAAVGAFLVGLTLTGESAHRARMVLSPLRDLFAAIFFLAIGVSVDPADLIPMLPAAAGHSRWSSSGSSARRWKPSRPSPRPTCLSLPWSGPCWPDSPAPAEDRRPPADRIPNPLQRSATRLGDVDQRTIETVICHGNMASLDHCIPSHPPVVRTCGMCAGSQAWRRNQTANATDGAANTSSQRAGDGLAHRGLAGPLAPEMRSNTCSSSRRRQPIYAAIHMHPVVSAMWRRCLMPTSIPAWSNVRLRQAPSARCGSTSRGPITRRQPNRSFAICWWSAGDTPGCGPHCMPPSEIRISASS